MTLGCNNTLTIQVINNIYNMKILFYWISVFPISVLFYIVASLLVIITFLLKLNMYWCNKFVFVVLYTFLNTNKFILDILIYFIIIRVFILFNIELCSFSSYKTTFLNNHLKKTSNILAINLLICLTYWTSF